MARELGDAARGDFGPASVATAGVGAVDTAELPPVRSVEVGTGPAPADRDQDRDHRASELDGLRALAVLCMIVYHVFFLVPVTWPVAYPWLLRLDLSVQVFFMLSGFLIYGPFARAHIRGTPVPRLAGYLLRRAARIYPAYWAAVGIMLVLGWVHFADKAEALQHLTLTFGYVPRPGSHFLDPPGLGQAWTLVVEVSFYGFVPLWAWAMRRLAVAGRVTPFRQELAGVAMLLAAGLAAAEIAVARAPLPLPFRVLPQHLTSLGWGMLLSIVAAGVAASGSTLRERWQRSPRRVPATELWWLAAWAVLALASPRLDVVTNEPGHLRLAHVTNLVAGILLVTPVILAVPGWGWVRGLVTWRPIVFVGVVSYGAYLWHLDLLIALPGPWVSSPSWPALAGMAVKVALSIAAGAASFFLLERPLMRVAARLARRGQGATTST